MTETTQGTMGDREMVTDLLAGQKQITSNYNTYAGECKCADLRNAFLDILHQEHDIQNELFVTMESKGWYPTKQAPMSEISAARQQFAGCC